MVAWLCARADKRTVCQFARIGCRTVGVICERVVDDVLDPGRLSGLVEIGVDEISWKKHRNYLTLVSDHATGKIVWGKAGRDTETLDAFFGDLPEGAAEQLEAVSMDTGPVYAKSVRTHAKRATICFDRFTWSSWPSTRWRRCGARVAGPARRARGRPGPPYHSHPVEPMVLKRATKPSSEFVNAARAIRKHRDGIDAALEHGLSNGRQEGLNNKVRLIIRRAYGFHSAEAALATVMLACGPVNLQLPYHTPATHM